MSNDPDDTTLRPAKLLEKVARLEEFAALPPEDVERALASLLRSPGELAADLPHVAATVLNRLQRLCEAASSSFLGRQDAIQLVAASFVSGVPVLLLGPPGTAKSALVRRIAQLCGLSTGDDRDQRHDGYGGYFEYLLTNHTMPEELFGGPDLGALREGKFKRITSGKLPEAEIAFLDEVFRGGGHILNTLLTIINEKRYDSGGGTMHVPMLGLVGASNSAPLEQELEAFFDRFPVRVWVDSVLEQTRWHNAPGERSARQLADHSLNTETSRLTDAWDPATGAAHRVSQQVSCTNDFRFARMYLLSQLREFTDDTVEKWLRTDENLLDADQREIRRRATLNDERFKQFNALFQTVRAKARLSDRSFGQFWLFGAAMDLLDKPDTLRMPWQHNGKGHLTVFRHISRTSHDVSSFNAQVDSYTSGVGHAGEK